MAMEILSPHITEAEWEVMRVVWANGQVTSKEVISILEDKMNWKAPTIKTLLGRLVEKGALDTERDGKRFIYTAAMEEDDTVRDYTRDIFSRICNKDIGHVIGGMVKAHELSFDDIRYLEEILEKKKATAVEEVSCRCVPGQCQCNVNHHGRIRRENNDGE